MAHPANTTIPQRPAPRPSLAARGRAFLLSWFPRFGLRSPGDQRHPQDKGCPYGEAGCGRSPAAMEREFASAPDFRELFQKLEAKQGLWGSQK